MTHRPPRRPARSGARPAARSNAIVDRTMAAINRRRVHVLLAEDDQEFRSLVEDALKSAGYRVTLCPDGIALADHIGSYVLSDTSDDFDLVVSDIRMPGVSGLEVLEGMSRWSGFPPMILMTAFGDEETHTAARRLGAAAVLDKPFELNVLLAVVREVVARRRRAASDSAE